jgi:hypothetical protein
MSFTDLPSDMIEHILSFADTPEDMFDMALAVYPAMLRDKDTLHRVLFNFRRESGHPNPSELRMMAMKHLIRTPKIQGVTLEAFTFLYEYGEDNDIATPFDDNDLATCFGRESHAEVDLDILDVMEPAYFHMLLERAIESGRLNVARHMVKRGYIHPRLHSADGGAAGQIWPATGS